MIMCLRCSGQWIRKCSARLLRELLARDVHAVIETVDELTMQGRELSQLAADFTLVFEESFTGEMFRRYGRCAGCVY